MKKLITILIVLLLACYAIYWTAGHSILRTEQDIAVLDKRFLSFTDIYVDIRGWSAEDFDAHPELKQAMREQGFRDYLAQRKAEELLDSMQDTLEGAKDRADQMSKEFKKKIKDWLESGAVSGVKKGQREPQFDTKLGRPMTWIRVVRRV